MNVRDQQNIKEKAGTYSRRDAGGGMGLETDIREDARMAAILKSRYTMLNVVDLDTGQCERVQLKGSGKQNVQSGDYMTHIERVLSEYICPTDQDAFRRVMTLEHLRSQAARTEEYYEETCQYRIHTDRLQWLEQHVIYSRQEERVLVNILGRDITREKEQEMRQLKELKERADVISGLSRLFFVAYYMDLERDTFRRVIGLDEAGEVLGKEEGCTEGLARHAENVILQDDRETYLKVMNCRNLMQSLQKDRPVVTVEYRKKQKKRFNEPDAYGWVRATAVLVQTGEKGEAKTALYMAQDITLGKQKEIREHRALQVAYEAAIRANASKNEFLSHMSHNIRTPMNEIIGMATVAGAHLDSPERTFECLDSILGSGRNLLSLLNEVLDMSRIEAGRFVLDEKRISLSGIMQEVIHDIRPEAEEKRQELRVYPMQAVNDAVYADPAKLRQVFYSILKNAVMYTQEGGLLEVSVTEKETKEYGYGYYDFVFADNGIGMEEEFQKHIFEPFCRAEDSRVSQLLSTGLGLTIAQNIVYMMGGDISVTSKPGEGSQFTVTLYLRQQRNTQKAESPSDAAEESSLANVSFEGYRILVVEDNEINREIAAEIIGSTGAVVESAVNGREALELFLDKGEGYYNLIFMDIQMPVMNGYDATYAIRHLKRRDAKTIPIVAISANSFPEDISEGKDVGMNEHLSKPLDVSRMMASMDYWLNKSSS